MNTGNNYKKLYVPAVELRKHQTWSERKMWQILRGRNFENLKFLRQKILGEFIVDFYCHELKLAIEIDGEIHAKQKDRDNERDNYLKNNFNLNILRYKNNFILNNELSIIKEKLKSDLENLNLLTE